MELFAQDPTEDDFVQDPYRAYDAARAQGPVLFWPAYGMPAVFSHALVDSLLRDRRLGRQAPDGALPPPPDRLAPFYAIEDNSMLELEPPRHPRLRALVTRAFTSARISALEDTIRALCNDLCTRMADTGAGPYDLLPDYCTPIPLTVITRLLGLPDADGARMLAWSHAMVGMYQAARTEAMEDAAAEAAAAFTAYLRGHISQRRAAPDTGLLSALIAARDDDNRLSEAELVATAILLLNAGHEATVHALGNTIKAALDSGMRGNWPAMAEEGLRHDPPLHLFTRWAYAPVEVAGHVLAPGTQVACMLGAAARDPVAWRDPHRFDPGRFSGPTPPQTAFGAGRHFCVGAPLARLEMRIALEVLFGRFPDLALAQTPRYAPIYHFHGLLSLRVRLR